MLFHRSLLAVGFACALIAPAYAERAVVNPNDTRIRTDVDIPQRTYRRAPHVEDPRLTQDEYTNRDPSRENLGELILDLADRIDDKVTPQDEVKSVNRYGESLDKVLAGDDPDLPSIAKKNVQSLSDFRFTILEISEQASARLVKAYEDLKKAAKLFDEAQKTIEKINETVQTAAAINTRYVQDMQAALQELERAIRGMNPGSVSQQPESTAGGNPPYLGHIQPQQPKLEPLDAKLEKAREKVKEAGSKIRNAESATQAIKHMAEEIRTKYKEAEDAWSKTQTVLHGSGRKQSLGEAGYKILMDAHGHLEKTVKTAKKIQEERFDKLLEPKDGELPKSIEDAKTADEKTQIAKEKAAQAVLTVDQAHHQIQDQNRPSWQQCENLTPPAVYDCKQNQADSAGQAKRQSEQVHLASKQPVQDADTAGQKAAASAEKAKKPVEKIRVALGERSPDELPTLRPIQITAQKPKYGTITNRTRVNKPGKMKIPHALGVSEKEIIGSYDNHCPNGRC